MLSKVLQVQRTSHLNTEALILDNEFFAQEPNAVPQTLEQRCIALANALVSKRNSVVVWPGTDDFLVAIDSLWRTTWPELRKMLTFTVAFTPQDAHLDEFSMVCTPTSEISRWAGFRVVTDKGTPENPSLAAAALIGIPPSESLLEIAKELRWPFKALADLEHVASLHESLTEVEPNAREEIRNLRLICFLVPNPSTAKSLKSTFLERARTAISFADTQDLLAGRNLALDCFQESERFWFAVTERVAAFCEQALDLPDFTEFLIKVSKESASPWKLSVVDGMRKGFQSFSSVQAAALWSWIIKAPESADLLFSVLPSNRSSESVLEASYPKHGLDNSIPAILSVISSRHMLRLTAKLLHTYFSVDDAFDWQLSNTSDGSGIPELVKLYSPREIVDQCARTADARLVPFAKAAVTNDVELVTEANLRLKGWKAIFIALRGSGVKCQAAKKFNFLQLQMVDLLKSTPQSEEFLAALEDLGLFDFSAFADSEQVWGKLPETLLGRVVNATADATVGRIATGDLRLNQVANELTASLQSRPRILKVLGNLGSNKIGEQLRLFRVFHQLTEQDFMNWYGSLLGNVRSLEGGTVIEIGSLIADRKWRGAAENAVRGILDFRRSDLTPLLPQVKPLLSIKQTLKLVIAGVLSAPQNLSPGDVWSHLEDVLAERFPGGPRDHGLWSRSRGEDADLIIGVSGREQWRHDLQLIRQNVRGSASLYNLLNEARKIFPYDGSLTWFEKYYWQMIPEKKGR